MWYLSSMSTVWTWNLQILEDCNKYIICTLQGDGTYLQQNMRCPGDLFYDEEHEDCVEESFICRNFQSIPCLNSCPRIMLSSTGPALQYKERLLGCFRLKGQKVGNTLVYYQNMNKFYLTPDAFSTPFIKHWLISELKNPTSGGIKNLLYDYLQCPYDGWNEGWEVDSGNGNWVDDLSVVTTCYKGEEGMSTTSSPTTTTTNYGVHSAMIITGGYNVQTEKPAEVFDVSTGQHCTLPQLPEGKVWHSQNGKLLCGGTISETTCIRLVDGEWITSHHLQTSRAFHNSWTTPSGDVLLVGGYVTEKTTELVKSDGTTEIGTLALKYRTFDACLIDEGDTFLVTGGPDLTNLKRVSRYSQSSWVEDLGDLNSGRYYHACGWFTDTGGRRVNIVVGGYDSNAGGNLDSVEVNVAGENSWRYGNPLAKPLRDLRGVTIMSQFYITGGVDDDNQVEDEIKVYQEAGWSTVSYMNVPRYEHAVSLVNFDDACVN